MTRCTEHPAWPSPAAIALGVGVQAGMFRQKRRMDVQHPALPARHEFAAVSIRMNPAMTDDLPVFSALISVLDPVQPSNARAVSHRRSR